jgi:hypothetical protein
VQSPLSGVVDSTKTITSRATGRRRARTPQRHPVRAVPLGLVGYLKALDEIGATVHFTRSYVLTEIERLAAEFYRPSIRSELCHPRVSRASLAALYESSLGGKVTRCSSQEMLSIRSDATGC